jgi:hypothetical protein
LENCDFDTLKELLKASDLYGLEYLKSLCEQQLFVYVNLHNCVSAYELADDFHAPELKEFSFKFMLKHYKELVRDKSGESVKGNLLKDLNSYLKL